MTGNVQSYRLPENAGRLDRATLRFWKSWEVWLRPVGASAALMVAGQLVVAGAVRGFGSGSSGGDVSWRLLAKWTPNPVSLTFLRPRSSLAIQAASIAAQIGAAALGALAAWWVLRRQAHPISLGAIAGLVAVVVHLGVAQLFTLQPFGAHGAAWAVTTAPSFRVIAGPVSAGPLGNALGVLALWSPVAFGAVVGWAAARRTRRRSKLRA